MSLQPELSLQPESAPKVVAIQGELGSNSHTAALAVLAGRPARILCCAVSADVFDALDAGTATAAVLPIENTLHGSVAEHYDLLLHHAVAIAGESLLHIRHNLIAAPGVRLEDLRQVLSHPVALSQCRRWLRAQPALAAVPFYDTAGSVKHLMSAGLRDTAGIAPALAAEQYGAVVLAPDIQDHADNYTRFLTIVSSSRSLNPSVSANKLSVAFSVEHRPGTLIRALQAFCSAGLNLAKLESLPVPGRPWEYIFFADIRFDDPTQLDAAFASLRACCQMVKELGRYPAA